jgi:hypothetical protein
MVKDGLMILVSKDRLKILHHYHGTSHLLPMVRITFSLEESTRETLLVFYERVDLGLSFQIISSMYKRIPKQVSIPRLFNSNAWREEAFEFLKE